MNMKILQDAVIKMIFGVLFVGLLIFVPAGTIHYCNGWLFMALLFVPMFAEGIIMMIKNPELLKKRLNSKENIKDQKTVIICSGFMFVFGFVVAGLDHRFCFSLVSKPIVIISTVFFLIGYLLYGEVIRENAYLSRTIEIQNGQKVVDTGLYSIVRHPMYSATLLMFLSIPLILGSFWSLLVFLSYPFIISKRIRSEEDFLKKELYGYKEYVGKVKYKIIPFIW